MHLTLQKQLLSMRNKQMKNLNEQLGIRKGVKKGYIVLYIALFIVLAISPKIISSLYPGNNITVILNEIRERNEADAPADHIQMIGMININEVDKEELMEAGIAEDMAGRWIKYRDAIQGYKTVDDLANLYGMSDKLFNSMKDCLYVDEKVAAVHKKYEKQEKPSRQSVQVEWREFDINEIDIEGLEKMGLPSKTAQAWVNFRAAIGGFSSIDQVGKVYGLKEDWLQDATAYMHIKEQEHVVVVQDIEIVEPGGDSLNALPEYVDINTASKDIWMKFPEINDTIAENIAKYRYRLGGYASPDELRGVYGLDVNFPIRYRQILHVENVGVIKEGLSLDFINTASKDEMVKHPLMNYKKARLIEKYRQQHGKYSSLEDLRRIKAIPPSWVQHIVRLSAEKDNTSYIAQD